MQEHLDRHDEEIQNIKSMLISHVEEGNMQRKDMNGNLAKIHSSLLRMEPVIKKYEDEQVFNEGIKKAGSRVIWWGQILGSGGVLVYAVRAFIRNGF